MHGFVLVVLNRPETARAPLEAAAQVAGALNDAHILALCVRIDPRCTILPSEEVLTTERESELEKASADRAAAVCRIYREWRRTHACLAEDRTGWSDPVGTVERQVPEHGRVADLIALAPPMGLRDLYGRQALKAAVFEADRPVLVVPHVTTHPLGRSIAILWDDERSTLRAVLDAMPLLGRANEIFVLPVVGRTADRPPRRLPKVLTDRGIDAELCQPEAAQGPSGKTLLDSAHRLGADLIVMGAYAHHPLREFLIGGITRYMISHADMPVFMRH